jgi:hypothetical protein
VLLFCLCLKYLIHFLPLLEYLPLLPHCKKSHVVMRQIPMLTTVAQNQTTWE